MKTPGLGLMTACTLFLAAEVGAATLEVSGGQLIGVNGVDIGGTLYDATFVDGTFASALGSTFDLSGQDAVTGANALASVIDETVYDAQPELIYGCPSIYWCRMLTPYTVFQTNLSSMAVKNLSEEDYNLPGSDEVNTHGTQTYFDSASSNGHDGIVYVDWSLSAIPLPPAAILFGSALLGTGLLARRKRN